MPNISFGHSRKLEHADENTKHGYEQQLLRSRQF